MAPPPPPPLCFPFGQKKRRPLSPSRTFTEKSFTQTNRSYSDSASRSSGGSDSRSSRSRSLSRSRSDSRGRDRRGQRASSLSPTSTVTSKADKLTFSSDSESYSNLPADSRVASPPPVKAKRGWGYGWGLSKLWEREKNGEAKGGSKLLSRKKSLPPQPLPPPTESEFDSAMIIPDSHATSMRSPTERSFARPRLEPIPDASPEPSPQASPRASPKFSSSSKPRLSPTKSQRSNRSNGSNGTNRTNTSNGSYNSYGSRGSGGSGGSKGTKVSDEMGYQQQSPIAGPSSSRPPLRPNDSSSTLVGSESSSYRRKRDFVDEPKDRTDTRERLEELRALMAKDNLDYYVIPSEDAHGSEYVASSDKRLQFISRFTGSFGDAIVSRTNAYLFTDFRYWMQAEDELDPNWNLVPVGPAGVVESWQEFLMSRIVEGTRIGLDARMIAWGDASKLNSQVQKKNGKLVFPTQNFVDLMWKEKPARSKDPISIQPRKFAGQDAESKIRAIRAWIAEQPPTRPTYAKGEVTAAQRQVATLITSLSNIAWVLNLRGRDIPYCPIFLAYLFIGLDSATLFVDLSKLSTDVQEHLTALGVDAKDYNDLWSFLRRAPWGPGRVLITSETSYAIALLLTSYKYTVAPSIIDEMKAVKNTTEIEGLQNAYLRDGAAYVRWLAWLEEKLADGYDISEWEAVNRLMEYRRKNDLYEGPSYAPISATGANGAMPHYSPTKADAKVLDRNTPYLNDSGAQYRDGTVDCSRTMHYGSPSPEQCEAYTRVLQGHIAIDSAIFPSGTSGQQLDVLARRALWKEGLNYLHGTGHGFGSYLNVHEGPHGFNSPEPLVPGHVLTNEPGFYNDGKWGIRIESALLVRKVSTKYDYRGNGTWLGFERLTVVPIQTKMVKDSMLSKDEISWIKEHNRRCRDLLEPIIRDDKRALKWLRREADKGVGLPSPTVSAGLRINWD